MVLITGSKFFTGPPLSGALLDPGQCVGNDEKGRNGSGGAGTLHQPKRLASLLAWRSLKTAGTSRTWGNCSGGSPPWKRCVRIFAVPESYRFLALQEFSRIIPRLIAERPNLHLLPPFEQTPADGFDDEMAARTIFPFFISHRGKLLSVEACGRIYRALNRDVSNLLSRLRDRSPAQGRSAPLPHWPARGHAESNLRRCRNVAYQRRRPRCVGNLGHGRSRVAPEARPGIRASADNFGQDRLPRATPRHAGREGGKQQTARDSRRPADSLLHRSRSHGEE